MTIIEDRLDVPEDRDPLNPAGGLEAYLKRMLQRRGQLARQREGIQEKAEAVLLEARSAGRPTLNVQEDIELRNYTKQMKELGDDITGLDERIEETRAEVERTGSITRNLVAIREAENTVTRVKEQEIYQKGDPRRSYMQDLIKLTLNIDDTGESRERLMRHAQDVRTSPDYKEFRDLSRVDGSGGYAVPPAWLMNQYIELARPGRAFANLVQRQPLPGGTDSINIPKLLTGTSTAIQTADNAPVADVDLTDTFINAPVRTISGQQGVAIQLIDQSPIAFDDVVFRDLVADHASQTDRQCLSGTGANGQVLGVRLTPNIGSVPASAVTTAGVYSAIANAIQTVHTTRFLPPEVIVMHPRRWGWFLSLLDGQQRPLFLPAANNPFNAAGILTDVASQQVVGQMHGLPVVTDPNLETNLGTGTNEDPIYVLRASDIVLWESGVRARVLPETKAANLTVLLQIYNYLAFSAARYPQSVVEITGLTAPTF
jgi:HK97 family phage major capsid protein